MSNAATATQPQNSPGSTAYYNTNANGANTGSQTFCGIQQALSLTASVVGSGTTTPLVANAQGYYSVSVGQTINWQISVNAACAGVYTLTYVPNGTTTQSTMGSVNNQFSVQKNYVSAGSFTENFSVTPVGGTAVQSLTAVAVVSGSTASTASLGGCSVSIPSSYVNVDASGKGTLQMIIGQLGYSNVSCGNYRIYSVSAGPGSSLGFSYNDAALPSQVYASGASFPIIVQSPSATQNTGVLNLVLQDSNNPSVLRTVPISITAVAPVSCQILAVQTLPANLAPLPANNFYVGIPVSVTVTVQGVFRSLYLGTIPISTLGQTVTLNQGTPRSAVLQCSGITMTGANYVMPNPVSINFVQTPPQIIPPTCALSANNNGSGITQSVSMTVTGSVSSTSISIGGIGSGNLGILGGSFAVPSGNTANMAYATVVAPDGSSATCSASIATLTTWQVSYTPEYNPGAPGDQDCSSLLIYGASAYLGCQGRGGTTGVRTVSLPASPSGCNVFELQLTANGNLHRDTALGGGEMQYYHFAKNGNILDVYMNDNNDTTNFNDAGSFQDVHFQLVFPSSNYTVQGTGIPCY